MLSPVELRRTELRPVGEPLDGGQAGAALQPGRAPLGEQLCPGRGRDPRCGDQTALAQRLPAEQKPVRRPPRSAFATASTISAQTAAQPPAAAAGGLAPSCQDTSAGTISVAT